MKADSQRKILGHLCAAWKCQLTMWPPPICLSLPPENKPLHINYTWQHCNAIERLGVETLHNLLRLLKKKEWQSNKMTKCSFSTRVRSVMCKTFIFHQSGVISCCLAVDTRVEPLNCVTSVRKGFESWLVSQALKHCWGRFVSAAAVWIQRSSQARSRGHVFNFVSTFNISLALSWERERKMKSLKEGFVV